MCRKSAIALIFLLTFPFLLLAQAGKPDPSFNTADNGTYTGSGPSATPSCIATQSDGKILIAGNFTLYNGSPVSRIIRTNSDGSIDPSFNVGTGSNGAINSIGILSNGKIVVVGAFTIFNSVTSKNIILLNADGSVDPGFSIGTGPSTSFSKCVVQSDDKIIVIGNFTTVNGTTIKNIVRLNTNGAVDGTFAIGTGPSASITSLFLKENDKIYISGQFTTFNGTTRNRIALLNQDGSVNTSFDPGTGLDIQALDLAQQSDGKIIAVGTFTTFAGISRKGIVRINVDGTIDTGFDPGTGFNNSVQCVRINSNDKILVGGSFTSYNSITQNYIGQLNADATVDPAFSAGEGPYSVGTPSVSVLHFLSDNSVLIGGGFSKFDYLFRSFYCKLNTSGAVDLNFNKVMGIDGPISSSASVSNGKLLIVGDFTVVNGVARRGIARIDSTGALDLSFAPSYGANGRINKLIKLLSGNYLLIGNFTKYNGTAVSNIACITPDGNLVSSFVSTGANREIHAASVQSDGKIVIGGKFTTFNGTAINRIARINPTGSLDNSFNPGTGSDSTIFTIQAIPGGKTIIGGMLLTYNGSTVNRIVRLTSTGSIDPTFTSGNGFDNYPTTSYLQSDGKILVGGIFTTYNASAANRIIRINTDGTLDASFTMGIGLNNGLSSIDIQPDGNILIGGTFSNYNGQAVPCIARLSPNGVLDATFNAGTGPSSGWVTYVSYQSDKRILVSGSFVSFNGIGKNKMTRIFSANLPDANLSLQDKTVRFGPTPITWDAFRNNSTTGVSYTIVSGTCATFQNPNKFALTCAGTVQVRVITPYDGAYTADTAYGTLTITKGQSVLTLTPNGAEAGSAPFKLQLDSLYDGTVEYKLFGDTNIATIDANGFITPKSPGTIKVIAIAIETSNYLSSLDDADVTIYPVKKIPLALNDTIDIILAQDTASELIVENDLGRTAPLDLDKIDLDMETDGIQHFINVPAIGILEVDSIGKLYYEPFEAFLGIDSVAYTVTDMDGLKSEPAWILFRSEKAPSLEPELKANTVMTPNGDGQNEVLLIGYADLSQKNELWVYDENGNEVFHADDYKNDWSGEDKKKKPLTNGIYYFIYKEYKADGAQSKEYKNYCQVIR